MKQAIRIAQLVADAHPEDVRLLFLRYNIDKEPAAQPIIDAYLVYGEPFLRELFEIAYKGMSRFSGIEGLEIGKLTTYADTKTAEAEKLTSTSKGGFWEGFNNVFSNAGSILTGATEIYSGLSSILNGKSVDTGVTGQTASQLELQNQMLSIQQQQAAEASKTKTWLLIGAGVLVAVLVVVMILKKK